MKYLSSADDDVNKAFDFDLHDCAQSVPLLRREAGACRLRARSGRAARCAREWAQVIARPEGPTAHVAVRIWRRSFDGDAPGKGRLWKQNVRPARWDAVAHGDAHIFQNFRSVHDPVVCSNRKA